MKYTRYTSHIIGLVHINIVDISTLIYAVCSQSVMIDTRQLYRRHFAWCRYCYCTWWLNIKWTICMLQLIHDNHRPNAQFVCYRYEYMMLVLFALLHVTDVSTWWWYPRNKKWKGERTEETNASTLVRVTSHVTISPKIHCKHTQM